MTWTAASLPSVVALTSAPGALRARFETLANASAIDLPSASGEQLIFCGGAVLRVHIDPSGISPPAVLLPLDDLFELRCAAAQRLWHCLCGGKPGVNPAALTRARRERLALALRTLDGRQAGATHRQIAGVLFGEDRVAGRAWISHDLRDRTARLARLGASTMNGGYRQLLLHPYRRLPRNEEAGNQ